MHVKVVWQPIVHEFSAPTHTKPYLWYTDKYRGHCTDLARRAVTVSECGASVHLHVREGLHAMESAVTTAMHDLYGTPPTVSIGSQYRTVAHPMAADIHIDNQ